MTSYSSSSAFGHTALLRSYFRVASRQESEGRHRICGTNILACRRWPAIISRT
ncbi:unnamed protein product, partial [Nesidiocoris tenuis]